MGVDPADPFPHGWRVPWMFQVMECCHELHITFPEFLGMHRRHQALHLAYLETRAQMQAVEAHEDWRRDSRKGR